MFYNRLHRKVLEFQQRDQLENAPNILTSEVPRATKNDKTAKAI